MWRAVSGLQTNLVALSSEALENDLFSPQASDHDLAVFGQATIFNDDDVSVSDQLAGQGIAVRLERKGRPIADRDPMEDECSVAAVGL